MEMLLHEIFHHEGVAAYAFVQVAVAVAAQLFYLGCHHSLGEDILGLEGFALRLEGCGALLAACGQMGQRRHTGGSLGRMDVDIYKGVGGHAECIGILKSAARGHGKRCHQHLHMRRPVGRTDFDGLTL